MKSVSQRVFTLTSVCSMTVLENDQLLPTAEVFGNQSRLELESEVKAKANHRIVT
jgi:hypothetical protein